MDTQPAEPLREEVQRGKYLDELELGVRYRHAPGRTITEADDVLFTTATMNPQALHLDAAWCATQPFGRPVVNSMFTLATVVGLSVGHLTQGTTVANLGFENVRFPAPMFHGDTLYAQTVVLETRASASRPGQGIARLEHTGRNQDGVITVVAVRSALMWYRQAHEARSGGGNTGGERS
ncbi:MaoC family dehydratase [Ruania alkalisoli]|uniref:MaoC family dehydratase n=1 Tax=Ruania alkalisoli TaxID=2779775 RepID=A0A7M1SWT3_9MICO|nr:MaoC family dehydratase [Ruania alkalisoli]QOR72028.1 MaoC family dehydratase [Ruania alkalisoli]